MIKYLVKVGCGALDKMMTLEQAKRWAQRNIPSDLKRCGFVPVVAVTDPEINGGTWIRINYAK